MSASKRLLGEDGRSVRRSARDGGVAHSQPHIGILAGDILEGPAGWLGQNKTQGEPKYRCACCHEEHASQANVPLQLRYEEHPDECTELADSRGDAVAGCAHAHGEHFGRQDKRRGVRPELDKEIAEPEDQKERHDCRGKAGNRAESYEGDGHDGEPDELQSLVADRVHAQHGQAQLAEIAG